MRKLVWVVVLLACVACGAAPVELVKGGASAYTIYVPAGAPDSVAAAARDLQKYVAEATGAELAISEQPREPMIALGDSAAAKAAGLEVGKLPLEGYRILTAGANLFIAGPDTAEGERTPQGGTSHGTRNGVASFLERFLGIRWLLPGERGDIVPKTAALTIPETDLSEAPFFLNRRLPYIQPKRDDVRDWEARQKLGSSLYLNHGHNWRNPVPPELFDAHPEYFAMRGGVRVPPTGRYKLCATDPGLIEHFAQEAIKAFDANPDLTCYSLSPSDSGGWCECDDCRAMYETDPNGDLSVTPAVLHFYNEVAKIVGQKYPDKMLAGYVYAAYVFPPQKPFRLQSNVFLVWAPHFSYGFPLFKPDVQAQWDDLLEQWTQVTDQISYYDLPVHALTESGAPNPPGLEILSFIYPRLKDAKMKGVYVYGHEAWGRGGIDNYLLARLAWDPDADVDALFNEYCEKAYGGGAEEMKTFWRLLDQEMKQHWLTHDSARYSLTADMMSEIYAAKFGELERLYRAAEAKATDPDAAARLAMVGDNLKVLHWNLRQFKLLDNPTESSFATPDETFFTWLSANRDNLALAPQDAPRGGAKLDPITVSPAGQVPNASELQPFLLRGDQHLILYPGAQGEGKISFDRITARGKLIQWALYAADGSEVGQGLLSAEVPITFDAAGSTYYHLKITAGSATFRAMVDNASWAADGRLSDQGLHLLGSTTPLYFRVADATQPFELSLEAGPPGETAVAKLYDPNGREVASFDCTQVIVDRQTIAKPVVGWYKLVIEKAATGVLDDVYVQSGPTLSGFFSPDPARALDVRPAK